jgi:hypothetical protein
MIFCLSLMLPNAFSAQLEPRETATVLPKGTQQVGVFGPLRLGLGNGLELQTHPVLNLLSPNLSIKKELQNRDAKVLSLQTDLTYSSFLISTLARDGIGGVLAPDIDVPKRLELNMRLLWTLPIHDNHNLTLRLRGDFSMPSYSFNGQEGMMPYTSIDMPLVYVRTHSSSVGINSGVNFDGAITDKIQYQVGAWAWYLPTVEESNWSIEQRSTLTMQITPKCWLQGGGIFVVGAYPYGSRWHILPIIDVQWILDGK